MRLRTYDERHWTPATPQLHELATRVARASADFDSRLTQLEDPNAVAHLQHHALAHLGLRRHIELDAQLPGAIEAEELLNRVVESAAALSGLVGGGNKAQHG
jgi:hypothetical protein